MKILYARISTIEQNTDRQKVKEKEYQLLVEDVCSGATPFFEREGGKKILRLVEKGEVRMVAVWALDRLGRDLLDILATIKFFTDKKIPVRCIEQGLTTLDENGNENAIAKMVISILGVVAEMERKQLMERRREGIEIAKAKGIYKGRQKGSVESAERFLNKAKNKKALKMLQRGSKAIEIKSHLGLNLNTITKIKKLSGLTDRTKATA